MPFLVGEIESEDQGCETLECTPAEYMQKISERNHDEVSALMESEIDHMEESHHFSIVHREGEKPEREEGEEYEEGGLDEVHTCRFLIE